MNKPVTDALKLTATSLGPVTNLDATLSKYAQNLVYARNGTGKSFLTRALRYLDLHAQGQDVSDAAFSLVSEEAVDSRGNFTLSRGAMSLGTLSLHFRNNQVSANSHERIFHVFSDDFVHSELRQQNFDLDGNIDNQIQLDQTNIDTKDVELKLNDAYDKAVQKRLELQRVFETAKTEELVGKASVRRQLSEYAALKIDSVLAARSQPSLPERSFKMIVSDLDALRSIPAEPDYPVQIMPVSIPTDRLADIGATLRKVTSPSSVSEEIKTLLGSNPDFFEAGLNMLAEKGTEDCPFCKQSIAHPPVKDRIELYLAYFADAEGKHKKALRSAWSDVKAFRTTTNERIAAIAREVLKFEALRKLISSQRAVELPDPSGLASKLDTAFGELARAIEAKGTSPSNDVSLPEVHPEPLLVEFNSIIDVLNDKFDDITKAIKKSDNERRRLQREACAIFELEFVHSHWAEINAIYSLYQEVAAAQTELDELKKSQLSTSVKMRVAQTFEALIASFFGKKYSFDRDGFVLKRNDKKMARGASRTLSDGEKTAIAFCYFIACAHKKVKSTSDYAKHFFLCLTIRSPPCRTISCSQLRKP